MEGAKMRERQEKDRREQGRAGQMGGGAGGGTHTVVCLSFVTFLVACRFMF